MLELLVGWIGIGIYVASIFGAAAYRMRASANRPPRQPLKPATAPESLSA